MDVFVVLVDKTSRHVLQERFVKLECIDIPYLQEMFEKLQELRPSLNRDDAMLYWQISEDQFWRVHDWYSYWCALNLMAEKKFYVLSSEMAKEKLRRPSIRTSASAPFDHELLLKVTGYESCPNNFTADLNARMHLLDVIKKGYPKEKLKLEPPPEPLSQKGKKDQGMPPSKKGK